MNQKRITESLSWNDPRGQVMKTPDDVAEMLRLRACGWGLKRIARQLGCSHHTVRDYVAAGGVKPFKSSERPKLLDAQRSVAPKSHSDQSFRVTTDRLGMMNARPL